MAAAVDFPPIFGTPSLATSGITGGYFDSEYGSGMETGNDFSDQFNFDMQPEPTGRVQDTVFHDQGLPNLSPPATAEPDAVMLPSLDTTSSSRLMFQHGTYTPISPNEDATQKWQSVDTAIDMPFIKQEDCGLLHSQAKRKRSSATADPSREPKRRRSRKSTSVSNSESEPQPLNPVEDEKRNKFLERNRVAASKCRQKKKEWTQNLESQARALQNEKNSLAALVESLRNEAMWLKGEMLKHTDCECAHIREYLAREAEILASGRSRSPAHAARPAAPIASATSPTIASAGSESPAGWQRYSPSSDGPNPEPPQENQQPD